MPAQLNLGSIYSQLGLNNKQFNKALRESKGLVRKFSTTIGDASQQAVIAFMAISVAAAGTTKNFSDFEKSMAHVNTIINVSSDELTQFAKEVINVSNSTGKYASSLANTLYDITSASVKASNSVDVLMLSTQAAVAGFTEAQITAKAGISTINAYGLEIKELSNVFDLQFAAVKKGIMTYQELSESLGSLLPSASKLGVSLEEVYGSLAFLTRQGQNARNAGTALARSFDGLISKSKNLKKIGVDVFNAEGNFKGFVAVIKDLKNELYGLTQEQQTSLLDSIGFDIRATRAIIPAIQNYKQFDEVIKIVSNSSGMMGDAFKNASDTIDYEFHKTFQTVSNITKQLLLKNTLIKDSLHEVNKSLAKIDFNKVLSSKEFEQFKKATMSIVGIVGALTAMGVAVSLVSNPIVQLGVLSATTAGVIETNFLGLGDVFDFLKGKFENSIAWVMTLQDQIESKKLASLTDELLKVQKISAKINTGENIYDNLGLSRGDDYIKSVEKLADKMQELGLSAANTKKYAQDLRVRGKIIMPDVQKGFQEDMKRAFLRISGDYDTLIADMAESTEKPFKSVLESTEAVRAKLKEITFTGLATLGDKTLEAMKYVADSLNMSFEAFLSKLSIMSQVGERRGGGWTKEQFYSASAYHPQNLIPMPGNFSQAGITGGMGEDASAYRDFMDSIDFKAIAEDLDPLIINTEKYGKALRTADGELVAYTSTLNDLSNAVTDLGVVLENDLVEALGTVMSQVSNIKEQSELYKQADTVGKLASGLSMFSSAVVIFSSVMDSIMGSREPELTTEQYIAKYAKLMTGGTTEQLQAQLVPSKQKYESTASNYKQWQSFVKNVVKPEYAAGKIGSGELRYYQLQENEAKRSAEVAKAEYMSETKALIDLLGVTPITVASTLADALNAGNLNEFGQNVEDQVKNAMIQAFLNTEVMRVLSTDLSDAITAAVLDSEISDVEAEGIESLMQEMVDKATPLLESVNSVDLGMANLAETTTELNQAFANLPTGIKLAAKVFEARQITPVTTQPSTTHSTVYNNNEIVIHIDGNDPEAIKYEVNKVLAENNLTQNGTYLA